MARTYLIKILFNIIGLICISQTSIYAQIHFPNEERHIFNFGRCLTPNRERGLCVLLEDCKFLYNFLLTSTLSTNDRLFLTSSQCGYTNGKVLICCSERHLQANTTNVSLTSSLNNINNLLPQPGQCGTVLSNRIYGGNKTKIDEYPWLALLEYTKANNVKGHHCGGSLINSRYVITASHCVNGKGIPRDWRLTGVRLGEWDTTTNPDCELDVRGEKDCAPEHIDVRIERAIPHPQYNPISNSQVNDIALLRLERNIVYTDFVRPICLPISNNLRSATFDGIIMDIAGWGKTEWNSASNLKLRASVVGCAIKDCRSVYKQQNIDLEDTQICAGGKEGIDSCRGDSGGPLVSLDTTNRAHAYYFLAGVVSFGPTPCGLGGWPGVYTRVGNYTDWIINNIQA